MYTRRVACCGCGAHYDRAERRNCGTCHSFAHVDVPKNGADLAEDAEFRQRQIDIDADIRQLDGGTR